MFDGKPPPKLQINSEGKLMIEPQGTAGAAATLTGSWIEMTIDKNSGAFTGEASLVTGFGLGPSVDLSTHIRPVLDTLNARLREARVQIKDITIDTKNGITITTEPSTQ